MRKLLTYNTIQTSLATLNSPVSPAEAHGVMCGMLAIDTTTEKQQCFQELLDSPSSIDTALQQMDQLFERSLQQLNDSNLHFDLLLPDDETALAKRLFAIQEWGRGLLYGAAVAGLKELRDLPKDSQEFLQDMAKIVASGELDLEEDEEAELAYTEIVEYVRIGTLLLSEELQPSKLSTAVH